MNDEAYELQRERMQQQERDDVRDAVRLLSRIANKGSSPKLFVEEMSREHRTLQQVMTGLMLSWFEHLAELPEGHYDLRNEASVKVAKKVMEATGGVTRLPLI